MSVTVYIPAERYSYVGLWAVLVPPSPKAQDQPVLVHCHAGLGRTGTMLHAYYLAEGYSLEEAKAKVKAGKPTSQFIMLSAAQKEFLEEFAAANDAMDNPELT